MAFFESLNISGSALTASRMRMDVISQNIANQNTTRTENGGPYRRKAVVYEAVDNQSFSDMFNKELNGIKGGVKVTEIVEDQTPFTPVYRPEHPDADENGYVLMPNVDVTQETLDFMETSIMYNANLSALEAIKNMAAKALEIGR